MPASCRNRQAALASHAGIWITDSILGRALDDYRRRSLASCGRLHSHSGPLESRRRLGRRNLAGLMPTTPIYPPLWQFDVVSLPGSWRWEPPTTREERKGRKKGLTFDRLIRWLEKSDADKPLISPDAVEVANDKDEEEAALRPMFDELPVEYPREIARLRWRLARLEEVDDDQVYRLCKKCRRSLMRRVRRGHLSVEGLLMALDPFDRDTLRGFADEKNSERFAAMIRRTVLAALDSVQKEDPHAVLEPLWLAFAAWVCAAGGARHANVQLLWRLMHGMPERVRAKISADQLLHITTSFVNAQAARHNVFAHWVDRAENFAYICQSLSASQRQILGEGVAAILRDGTEISERNKRMRFSWLMVAACDASVSYEAFVDSYQRLFGDHGLALNSLQWWQLMLGRAKVAGLPQESYSRLVEMQTPTISQRWSALIKAVSDGNGSLKDMFACLKLTGELDMVGGSLLSTKAAWVRVDAVRALFIACDDHRLALRLYRALEGVVDKHLLHKHFPWTIWAPYVRRLINDPELDSLRIPSLLMLSRPGGVAAKVELLDKMGQWYMEARHFGRRQRLRRIGECAAIQRLLINSVSRDTLASLATVIVGDLDRGDWGRTTRLEWLVRLVAEVQGEKEAQRVASVLNGWRYMINQSRQ